jgi:hypothetical protein
MIRDKIYLSGPVSSIGLDEARRRFGKAEADLQRQGYRTCNPTKMTLCVWLAQHGHYRLCLWLQLLWMSATCQCIYLLDGWHTSDGARAERAVARVMGIVAMYERPLRRTASAVSKTAEAFAELGKAVAACGVNDKTIKPKSKKHKKD